MNKPIRTIAMFCLLLFLALMLNATYLQYYKAGSLDKDQRNRRVIAASFARERGAILVGRTAIAKSVPSDDEYKFQRTYPEPFKYAGITGWFSYYGQTGVEQTENAVLSGDDSLLFVTKLVDLLSNNASKGGSVQLTIDDAAQTAAFDGLSALPGDVQASVVAIEPNTGKILAMASLPTFDPNRLASHDLRSVGDTYERLNQDPDEPLLNRAIQTRLPPGSTFKVVTAAAAIESGNYDAGSQVPGGAQYTPAQTSNVIDNEGRDCGTGRIPFTQAMENSCNTTFAALANEVGAEAMTKQAEAFGFNSHYLDDLGPQAESNFPTDPNLSPAFVAQTGIGQYDVAATPLQMAMVAAGIANGGTVMKPYLVDEVQSPDGLDVLDKTEPSELSRAVSASTASELTKLLVATVEDGTANPAAIPGIEVAGKTGTAQSGQDNVPPYAWFISFAPADDPKVAVAVMIQKAGIPRDEIAGGVYGGPIAKAVMQAVIQ